MAVKPSQKRAVLTGMNLALENARSLLKDARILLRHRRPNASFALTVLAMEEAGRVLYLTLVPDPKLCRDLFTRHPERLRLILAPDWKTVFLVRRHKLPEPGARPRVRLRRATAELARYFGRHRGSGPGFSVRGMLELRDCCLRSDPARPEGDMLWPNGLPHRIASAGLAVAVAELDDLSRLRDVYRRGLVTRLSEQIAQVLHAEPRRRSLLRDLRIPLPARPRLLPASGAA